MKIWLAILVATSLTAQTEAPAGRTSRIIGEVSAQNRAGNQLTVKADKGGGDYTVTIAPSARLLRVTPGETDLKHATPITPADITVGDRVMVRGAVSEENKSASAVSIILMSKSDLAQKRLREREEWERRGLAGVVRELRPDTHQILITWRGRSGEQQATVITTSNTAFRRYAPDSVRFADAKPSSFSEIRPGDQVRVLGDKSADGAAITAEQIVSGAFRTLGGTVISVDAAKRELSLKDLESKKPVIVRVTADTQLRTLTPQVAMILAMRLNPDFAGNTASRFQGRQGAPGNGREPDMQKMLERMPAFTLEALKPGDPLIVASTAGASQTAVTAITVLSGVEPILRAAPRGQLNLGTWSLEMQMPE
jgi:transcription antitermination factor NusG